MYFDQEQTKNKNPKPAPEHGNALFWRELFYFITVQGLYTFTMGLFSSHGFFPFPTTCTITGG